MYTVISRFQNQNDDNAFGPFSTFEECKDFVNQDINRSKEYYQQGFAEKAEDFHIEIFNDGAELSFFVDTIGIQFITWHILKMTQPNLGDKASELY